MSDEADERFLFAMAVASYLMEQSDEREQLLGEAMGVDRFTLAQWRTAETAPPAATRSKVLDWLEKKCMNSDAETWWCKPETAMHSIYCPVHYVLRYRAVQRFPWSNERKK